MFLVVFINYLPILIGCFNIIINFLDDISNLICTLLSRIYRYRLLITRTNNYLIASFILLFLLLIGIVINSLVYSCIIVFNCTIGVTLSSNIDRIFYFSLRNIPWYGGISVYNSGWPSHKIQRSPQQYTRCTYTQFTDTKSLLNSSNNSISHSSLSFNSRLLSFIILLSLFIKK